MRRAWGRRPRCRGSARRGCPRRRRAARAGCCRGRRPAGCPRRRTVDLLDAEAERVGRAVRAGPVVHDAAAPTPAMPPSRTAGPGRARGTSPPIPPHAATIPTPDLGPGSAQAASPNERSAISGQQLAHRGLGEQPAVRGGVDQPERRVGHRAGPVEVEVLAVVQPQLPGPEVDVLALEGADLLARLEGQRLPVAVLHDDQRAVPEGEVDVPVDQRPERAAPVAGGGGHARDRRGAAPR